MSASPGRGLSIPALQVSVTAGNQGLRHVCHSVLSLNGRSFTAFCPKDHILLIFLVQISGNKKVLDGED